LVSHSNVIFSELQCDRTTTQVMIDGRKRGYIHWPQRKKKLVNLYIGEVFHTICIFQSTWSIY